MQIVSAMWRVIKSKMRSHLCEACVDEEIQTTTKDLVAYQDRDVEISDGHCATVLSRIMPTAGGCESEHDDIGDENDGEQFPVM